MNPILQLVDVTRIHGAGETEVKALRGVSMSVRAGELVAVMVPPARASQAC
jgi:putative ABC transport system ATP-binding protein